VNEIEKVQQLLRTFGAKLKYHRFPPKQSPNSFETELYNQLKTEQKTGEEELIAKLFIKSDLNPTKDGNEDAKLKYLGTQEFLSISLCGSEETESIFIPVTGTTKEALQEMLKQMELIRSRYVNKMYEK
jgi:hypothetical protein